MKNAFGLNPKFKDFLEKYPDKTLVGVMWAMYWRFALLIVAIEFVFLIACLIAGLGAAILFH